MNIDSKAEKYVLFPWSKQKGINRKTIVRAKGIYFWDNLGKKYIDFASQLVNVNLGHNHPKLIASIKRQTKYLIYTAPSFTNKPKVDLAESLVKLSGLGKAFFTTGGSEANENAIIIARQFSHKDVILSRNPSYHGATYGSRSASKDATRNYEPKYNSPFFDYFSAPYCYKAGDVTHKKCCETSLNELKSLIKKYHGNIAAVILEPIPGGQGVLIPSKGYLKKLISICRKNKILVILDEIMTGFGRTGKWFSYQHWGVKPDILVLSKGISAGAIPLGAVVISRPIANYFNKNVLVAGLTNSGHPLACAIGQETIRIYKSQNIVKKAHDRGVLLEKCVNEIKKKYSMVGDVRCIGLFCAIEFSFKNSLDISSEFATEVAKEAYKNGLYLYLRLNCLLIAPPLTITNTELIKGIELLNKAILVSAGKFNPI